MVETTSPDPSVDPTFVDLLAATSLVDSTGGSSGATLMSQVSPSDGRLQGESSLFLSSLDAVAYGGGA